MDDNKPLIASREEVQKFFEEDQIIEDEEARKRVAQAAINASEAIRGTALINSANIKGMINADDGRVLDWMYRTLPPQNGQVEVNPPGPPKPGGGSKSKQKKDRKGNKAYTDPWKGI